MYKTLFYQSDIDVHSGIICKSEKRERQSKCLPTDKMWDAFAMEYSTGIGNNINTCYSMDRTRRYCAKETSKSQQSLYPYTCMRFLEYLHAYRRLL